MPGGLFVNLLFSQFTKIYQSRFNYNTLFKLRYLTELYVSKVPFKMPLCQLAFQSLLTDKKLVQSITLKTKENVGKTQQLIPGIGTAIWRVTEPYWMHFLKSVGRQFQFVHWNGITKIDCSALFQDLRMCRVILPITPWAYPTENITHVAKVNWTVERATGSSGWVIRVYGRLAW